MNEETRDLSTETESPEVEGRAVVGKRTVRDVDLAGKTVLVRVDYNVPFHPGTTEIADDSRITGSLPTVRYLIEQRCKVVLCSHLGRPKGKVVEELRMGPVAKRLSELLGSPVVQAPDCIGPKVRELVDGLAPGDVLMLENLRFHPEEEANDPEFGAALVGSLIDLYVNDAFGAAHRAHASIVGVADFLPAVSGLLMARELEVLGSVLDNPRGPFVAILGGAKVDDKIAVLRNFAKMVDTLIVGGGMAATFLRAQGLEVGESVVEEDRVQAADELIGAARDGGLNLLLPEDLVIADAFRADAQNRVVKADGTPAGWRIMDIGPRTASSYESALSGAKTVVWNGPMGVSEWQPFAEGTSRVANAVAGLAGATTVIGGGSTAEVVIGLGLADEMTHVSTGGGASLKFLEGSTLPGVAALMDKG